MDATINGKKTKPIPANVTAAMRKGLPKATAQAMVAKPKSIL